MTLGTDAFQEDGENRHVNVDGQTCLCGEHADVVDGRCRRCGLPQGEVVAEPAVSEEAPPVVDTPAE